MPAVVGRLPIDQDWVRNEEDYTTSVRYILGCTNNIRANAIFCFTCITSNILCFAPQALGHTRTRLCAGGPSAGVCKRNSLEEESGL